MNNSNRLYWSKIIIWKILVFLFGVWCMIGPYSPIWGEGEWHWDNLVEDASAILLIYILCLLLGFVFLCAGNGYMLKYALGEESVVANKNYSVDKIDDSYTGAVELFCGALFFIPLLFFPGKIQHAFLGSQPIINILKLSSLLSINILVSLFIPSRRIFVHRPNWSFSKNAFNNVIGIMLLILIVSGICIAITAFWYLTLRWIFVLYQNLAISMQQAESQDTVLDTSIFYLLMYIFFVLIGAVFFVYSLLFFPFNLSSKCLGKIQTSILPVPNVKQ